MGTLGLDRPFKMSALQCSNLEQNQRKSLVKYIGSEKHFNFHPYTFTPRWVLDAKLYATSEGGRVDILIDEMQMNILTWLATVSPTLLPFILESRVGTMGCNPQMVMR